MFDSKKMKTQSDIFFTEKTIKMNNCFMDKLAQLKTDNESFFKENKIDLESSIIIETTNNDLLFKITNDKVAENFGSEISKMRQDCFSKVFESESKI